MAWKNGAVAIITALAALLAAPSSPAQPGGPPAAPDPEAASPERSGWRDPQSWRRLRVGMSQGEVLRILGDPGRVTPYYGFTRWEYPDALGLRVNFDERGRLLAWGALAR